jgi:hypothetical protein
MGRKDSHFVPVLLLPTIESKSAQPLGPLKPQPPLPVREIPESQGDSESSPSHSKVRTQPTGTPSSAADGRTLETQFPFMSVGMTGLLGRVWTTVKAECVWEREGREILAMTGLLLTCLSGPGEK